MSRSETDLEREAPSQGGDPNWNWTLIIMMIGVIIAGATLTVNILGTSDVALEVGMIPPPEQPASFIVATIREHEFEMPEAVLDEWVEHCNVVKAAADSLVAQRASDLTPELSALLDGACESIGGSLRRRYFVPIMRWATIALRNEGSTVAREVSVRIPNLITANWRLDFGDSKVIPRQSFPRPYTIEVGNLIPGESALISAWMPRYARDTITVFQEAGETVIRRPQRSAD